MPFVVENEIASVSRVHGRVPAASACPAHRSATVSPRRRTTSAPPPSPRATSLPNASATGSKPAATAGSAARPVTSGAPEVESGRRAASPGDGSRRPRARRRPARHSTRAQRRRRPEILDEARLAEPGAVPVPHAHVAVAAPALARVEGDGPRVALLRVQPRASATGGAEGVLGAVQERGGRAGAPPARVDVEPRHLARRRLPRDEAEQAVAVLGHEVGRVLAATVGARDALLPEERGPGRHAGGGEDLAGRPAVGRGARAERPAGHAVRSAGGGPASRDR